MNRVLTRFRRAGSIAVEPGITSGRLCVGGLTSAFLAPVPLLHTTATEPRGASDDALLAGQEVYLNLGTFSSRAGAEYYRITSVHLSTTSAHLELRFKTSSLVLLGDVLRAGEGSGRIPNVSLAFRSPNATGRPTTELVETFAPVPWFEGVVPLLNDFAQAAKVKCETLRTDVEIFEVWTSLVVSGERLVGFHPLLPTDASVRKMAS